MSSSDMMICIGPADAIQSQAAQIQALLAGALAKLEALKSKSATQSAAGLRAAIEKFEWIHKALRGECPPPPRKPRQAAPAPEISKLARKLLDLAADGSIASDDQELTERLH